MRRCTLRDHRRTALPSMIQFPADLENSDLSSRAQIRDAKRNSAAFSLPAPAAS